MKTVLLSLCLVSSVACSVQAQEPGPGTSQSQLAFNFSTIGQDIRLGYSGHGRLGIGTVNYAISAEIHDQPEYSVASFQISHETSFPLSESNRLTLSIPFVYDAHPSADLSHFSLSPRIALVSSFRGGSSLTSFFELAVDRANISEQDHSTRRAGFSYSLPINSTQFEITSSVAELSFRDAEIHETFFIEMSLSHSFSEDVSVSISASEGRDFAKILSGGEIFRGVTDQRNLSLSLRRSFGQIELSPYIDLSEMRSERFETRDLTVGFRITSTF